MNDSPKILSDLSSPATSKTLQGKTYSLRLHEPSSEAYYKQIARLADALLLQEPDGHRLLARIKGLSKSRRTVRKLVKEDTTSPDGLLIETLRRSLAGYTTGVRSHLRRLRIIDRWGSSLATTEEQYYLFMVEIELVNRLNAEQFRASGRKLAFLPHCLRDLSADCRAAQRDIDYVCKGCTDDCRVNHASKMLRLHGVKPYIWMTADLRAMFRKVRKEGDSLGILGIACIPELVRGMRMCLKYDFPVVGVPLDANRCVRWWGEFYWNSVNLKQLENLLTG